MIFFCQKAREHFINTLKKKDKGKNANEKSKSRNAYNGMLGICF